MLKYIYDEVTFAEIPDEISLCFSISNCDGLCEGCHSPELRGDCGKPLSENIERVIDEHNYGITCVCFLGEGRKDPNAKEELISLVKKLRKKYQKLKFALYSGRPDIDEDIIKVMDYYKVGPYIQKLGPLTNKNTNQKLYKINRRGNEIISKEDITNKFWEDRCTK